MKHFPALLLHILLLILARLTVNDAPDIFLGCAALVLILHFGWAIDFKRNYVLPSCMALGFYFLAEPLGLVTIESGYMGLGGGGFGWLFYGVALAISLAAHSILGIVRYIRRK